MEIWIWPGVIGLAACSIYLIWYMTPRTGKVVIDLTGLGDDERENQSPVVDDIPETHEEEMERPDLFVKELEVRLAKAYNEGYCDFKNGRNSWYSPDEGVATAEKGESSRRPRNRV